MPLCKVAKGSKLQEKYFLIPKFCCNTRFNICGQISLEKEASSRIGRCTTNWKSFQYSCPQLLKYWKKLTQKNCLQNHQEFPVSRRLGFNWVRQWSEFNQWVNQWRRPVQIINFSPIEQKELPLLYWHSWFYFWMWRNPTCVRTDIYDVTPGGKKRLKSCTLSWAVHKSFKSKRAGQVVHKMNLPFFKFLAATVDICGQWLHGRKIALWTEPFIKVSRGAVLGRCKG